MKYAVILVNSSEIFRLAIYVTSKIVMGNYICIQKTDNAYMMCVLEKEYSVFDIFFPLLESKRTNTIPKNNNPHITLLCIEKYYH